MIARPVFTTPECNLLDEGVEWVRQLAEWRDFNSTRGTYSCPICGGEMPLTPVPTSPGHQPVRTDPVSSATIPCPLKDWLVRAQACLRNMETI